MNEEAKERIELTNAPPVVVCADIEPQCFACKRMLARKLTRPWVIDCPRCRARNVR